VHAPVEGKSDDSKGSFCEEVEEGLDSFPKYYMKFMLDFNAKVRRADIFKLTIWTKNFHESDNDNGVRVVNFATSENLLVNLLKPSGNFMYHQV
jgi:hypothetical protein